MKLRPTGVVAVTGMFVMAFWGVGCKSAGDTADTAIEAFCTDAPVVNYANFGESFINHSCQGCHASALAVRFDAPIEVTFDTVDQVWQWRDRILERCELDSPTMPPRGGVTDDELLMLHWWLECATIGT
jgi:cytochrome c5